MGQLERHGRSKLSTELEIGYHDATLSSLLLSVFSHDGGGGSGGGWG